MNYQPFKRRGFIKSTALGILGISTLQFAEAANLKSKNEPGDDKFFYRYPGLHDDLVSGIVGASHGNFDKVKQLIGMRPELATACWDWGFGDFETALGAASHVGRRDIAEYLISHGARPDIFTFAMLGMLTAVQEIIETMPGIQSHYGPHGITLLAHARNRLTDKNITATDSGNVNKVIVYLQSLGNADIKPKNLEVPEEEKTKYIGEFRFGVNDNEILIVSMNSRKMLQIQRKGAPARTLFKIEEHTFSPSGAPSVKIIFKMKDEKAITLSIHEPEPLVNAVRI